jgi:hypothetical protein
MNRTADSMTCIQAFSRSRRGFLNFMVKLLLTEQAKTTKLLWGSVFKHLGSFVHVLFKIVQSLISQLNLCQRVKVTYGR